MMNWYQFDIVAVSETWLIETKRNSNKYKSMVTYQHGKIESPKLEEVLVSTPKNSCHSKY